MTKSNEGGVRVERTVRATIPEFETWLRTVCFQAPTPEAYDLARDAWIESQIQERGKSWKELSAWHERFPHHYYRSMDDCIDRREP